MCSNDEYFFEGAEKLLEIWFASGLEGEGEEAANTEADLRKIPRAALESVLKLVKCEIISFKRSPEIDAYVLSESSMFISRDRLIIKTCGSTGLLNCLEAVIFLAKEVAGFDEILDVFYSRKNFLRPDLQSDPHRSFAVETEVLDSFFDEGAAYCMGRMNSDHWFLYTLAPAIASSRPRVRSHADQTLEVLMHGLDAERMRIFTKAVSQTARQATESAGIDKLLPGMVIDDFLFDPCGYSMNGLMRGGFYVTIHVTPEPEFSYVSFETNFPTACHADLISRVVRTFQPTSFMVTLLATSGKSSTTGSQASAVATIVPQLKAKDFQNLGDSVFAGFKMKELQTSQVNDYLLSFVSFTKFPS